MTQDESQQVEEALQAWRRWQQRQSFAEVRGMWYPGEDSSCREFRAKSNELRGRELDDEADRQLDAAIGEVVDPLVDRLDQAHRIAINMHFMNQNHAVWRNRRVEDVHRVYQEAKAVLLPMLYAAGIVSVAEAA
ncbi:hypothetical protein [Cupriavidus gilardii]|uniref:Uncharacterized protein n=1 Tax=Cupriavidus gilardii TaxID=82541 RepID=A0A849BL03_9BURK|nr:hypothetical protein [Cupriavidus gilardii]KAB0592231.1 hypothetical protein F7Q96_26415 [Cupriavidus gilardii]NNH14403.1 hypothetical protein [Cupriavidus gilardii]